MLAATLANAFNHDGQELTISRRDGRSEGASDYRLNPSNQINLEILHCAESIRSVRKRPVQDGSRGCDSI
jgi:hypothetical protein